MNVWKPDLMPRAMAPDSNPAMSFIILKSSYRAALLRPHSLLVVVRQLQPGVLEHRPEQRDAVEHVQGSLNDVAER